MVLTLLLVCIPALGQEPTRADFDAQLARLTPTASSDDRLRVAEWIKSNATSKHAPRAMSALARLVRKDPDAEVRARAVAALVLVARGHQKPCPLAVVEAVRDPDEGVRVNAAVGLFKDFEPGAVQVLLEGTQHKHPDVRDDCVILLPPGNRRPEGLEGTGGHREGEDRPQFQRPAHGPLCPVQGHGRPRRVPRIPRPPA
jgi:hypothetical protein